MTPEQRIAAIQERVQYARDSDTDPRSDLITLTITYEQDELLRYAANDITWLLAYTAALRDVAEAAEGMPEPVGPYGACVVCGVMPPHRDKCPYARTQAALQRWKGVAG